MNDELKNKLKILEAREKRVSQIRKHITKDQVILSLRANYPGDYKDLKITRRIITILDEVINREFKYLQREFINCGEGYVFIYILDSRNSYHIKHKTIEIEKHHPLGRLVDLDVYYKSEQSISRRQLNVKPRTCFLCDEVAHYCIRNKTHTFEELSAYINRVVEDYEQRRVLS